MKKINFAGNWYLARLLISTCVVLVVVLIFFAIYRLWVNLHSTTEKVNSGEIDTGNLPSPQELERAVSAINSRLSQNTISNEGVRIEGRKPSARYTITSDHPNYYFQTEGYTIKTGGKTSKIPTAGICQLVNKIEQESSLRVLEALDKIDVEAELGPTGASMKSSGPLGKFLEVGFALREFGNIPKRKAEIILKGYADGQESAWIRDLEPEPYHFTEIPVLFPVARERASYNPVTFSGNATILSIPSRYTNKHLPDLRAAFFKQDFIEPFLDDCWSVGEVTVHIIKGYEFEEHDTKERRVDVQVNLY